MITPSPITAADVAPPDELALWAPFDVFRGEWASPIALAHTYETEIGAGGLRAEQRRALRGSPVRTLTLPESANDRLDAVALRAKQLRASQARSLAALITEQSSITADADAGSVTIQCDTENRLFFIGGRVALFRSSPGKGRAAQFEIAQVDAVAAGQITLAAPTATAFVAGDRVAPLMEAEPVPDLRAEVSSSSIMRTATALRSSPARGVASTIPATQSPNTPPAGAAIHDGLPILDVWPDFNQMRVGVIRADASDGLGMGRTIAHHDERAARIDDLGFTFHTRAAARRLLAWFDFARARTFPFWYISPIGELRVAIDGSIPGGVNLVVDPIRFEDRFGVLPEPPDTIAVVRRVAGVRTFEIRRIVSTLLVPDDVNPAFEQLTLDAALPAIPANEVDRVSFAFKAHFADDELIERWFTTEKMRSGIRVVETLREADVEVGAPNACADPPMGVIYDCTPPESTLGPPVGNYKLASICAGGSNPNPPALYVASGLIALTKYLVIQWRGLLYAYIARSNDPIFDETQIDQDDVWLTDLSQAAFEALSCPDAGAYITCRENTCPGGALQRIGSVFDMSKAACEATTPQCPDTFTICSQTAPLSIDQGCPDEPNVFCAGQDIMDPPACYARDCIYECAEIPNITTCH